MPMKEKCTLIISSLAYALEMIITIAMLIGTGLLCFRLICSIFHLMDGNPYASNGLPSIFHLMDGNPFEAYEHLLSYSMNLIICVELIRMMYYHTSDMVFELLVFALARQVIIDHTSAITSLIGVCAIAVLFATRKFLFTTHVLSADTDDEGDKKSEKENK